MSKKENQHKKDDAALKIRSITGKKTVVQALKNRWGLFKHNLAHGNTKIHQLVLSHCTPEEFKTYIAHIGDEKAILQAKKPNDDGKLPIDVIASGSDAPKYQSRF